MLPDSPGRGEVVAVSRKISLNGAPGGTPAGSHLAIAPGLALVGTFCTSGQRKGSKISVYAPPAMPACRLHSRDSPPGSVPGRGCPSAGCQDLLPARIPPSWLNLHLLTSLTPSVKWDNAHAGSADLSRSLGGLEEPEGKKEVCKRPVALQTPGRRTRLSPSWQGLQPAPAPPPVPGALGCKTQQRHCCQSRGPSFTSLRSLNFLSSILR